MSTKVNHIAIIMDGITTWAKQKKLPRTLGHLKSLRVLNKIASEANNLGIEELSVFALNSANYAENKEFYQVIPNLYARPRNFAAIAKTDYRIKIIGKKNIPKKTQKIFTDIENATKDNTGIKLNICFNYSFKDELHGAIKKTTDLSNFDNIIANLEITTPVDILIRTGGKRRLSDFLLLQIYDADIYFTDKYWPDFTTGDLISAIKYYNRK